MSQRESGSNYYDLQVQQQELQHQLECLNSEASSRQKDNEKLCLFYEQELQQWLNKMDKQKMIWTKKRKSLSQKCTNLQESVRGLYSTNSKLNQEKEKYCNVMSKLMPEWQKAIERKQMKEISEFENRVSLIQQRRHSADIAFEKEKKLLSLISIRQKQIQKLEDEEKQEAVIREQQRNAIMQHENDYNDKLRLSKSQTFADVRLQEYIIRKSVTSDLEKKYNHQIDEIKTRLSQNKLIDFDELRSTLNYTQKPQTFDDDVLLKEEEEKDNNVIKNEEGNETEPKTEDINVLNEYRQNDVLSISTDLNTLHFMNDIKQSAEQIPSDEESDTSKIEQAIGLIEVNHNNEEIVSSIPEQQHQQSQKHIESMAEMYSIQKQEDKIDHVPPKKKIQFAPQKEIVKVIEPVQEEPPKQIEEEKVEPPKKNVQSLHKKENEIQSVPQKQKDIKSKAIETIEVDKSIKINEIKKKSPPRLKPKGNSKLKRSFRARTSKNRLQFSVFGMVSPKKQDNEPKNAERANEYKEKYDLKCDQQKQNEFVENKKSNLIQDNQPNEDESSEDGFDDLF